MRIGQPYIIVILTDSSFCLGTSYRWVLVAQLILNPEDGGDTFLRNVGSYTDYTADAVRTSNSTDLSVWMAECCQWGTGKWSRVILVDGRFSIGVVLHEFRLWLLLIERVSLACSYNKSYEIEIQISQSGFMYLSFVFHVRTCLCLINVIYRIGNSFLDTTDKYFATIIGLEPRDWLSDL
jgi:hypothetical protein